MTANSPSKASSLLDVLIEKGEALSQKIMIAVERKKPSPHEIKELIRELQNRAIH